jgi:hypothetical protein
MGWAVAVDDVVPVAERLGTPVSTIVRRELRARLTGVLEAMATPLLPFFVARDPGIEDPGASGAVSSGSRWPAIPTGSMLGWAGRGWRFVWSRVRLRFARRRSAGGFSASAAQSSPRRPPSEERTASGLHGLPPKARLPPVVTGGVIVLRVFRARIPPGAEGEFERGAMDTGVPLVTAEAGCSHATVGKPSDVPPRTRLSGLRSSSRRACPAGRRPKGPSEARPGPPTVRLEEVPRTRIGCAPIGVCCY